MSRNRRRVEVHISLLDDPSLARRLRIQLAFALAEAKRDPAGFARSMLADGLDTRERRLLWSIRLGVPVASSAGFCLGVLAYILFVGIAPTVIKADPRDEPPIIQLAAPQRHDTSSTAKPGGGGGGGGDQDPTPMSQGQPPPSSLRDPIVPATTKPVPQMPDPLPVPPPIKAAQLPVLPPDRYGDPTSTIPDASDGPGSHGGAGTGDNAGWGPGHDRGEGPGETDGRGGPPGPDGGRPEADVPLATRAVILNAPRPSYTDLAREHHTQGTVGVRVLLGADGRVRQARVVRGLPDGLDERAIQAVYQLRFRPATNRDGRAVDSWVTVSVNFTIR